MRIEFAPNEVVVIAQPIKTNGHARVRYSMVMQKAVRQFYDFDELVKAMKKYFRVEETSK